MDETIRRKQNCAGCLFNCQGEKSITFASDLAKALRVVADFLEWQDSQHENTEKTIEKEMEVLRDGAVSDSEFYTVTQIAKEFGISGRRLNEILENHRIHHNVKGKWVLYRRYRNSGIVACTQYEYNGREGKKATKNRWMWTSKGKDFIRDVLEIEGIHQTVGK